MRITILSLAMLLGQISVQAQASADEMDIEAVITRLFDGMHDGDSSKVRSTFIRDPTLATIFRNRMGQATIMRNEKLSDFLNSVASSKGGEPYTEEIWKLSVKIDGDFAQAWCDYAFYLGKKFSHCGVDAFQLFKAPDGWKIFHLADTRRKQDCVIPQEIQAKYK